METATCRSPRAGTRSPVNETEARRALEWIASREGKLLDELVREHRQSETIAA